MQLKDNRKLILDTKFGSTKGFLEKKKELDGG